MAKPKIIQIAASGTNETASDGYTTTYDTVFALLEDGRVMFHTVKGRDATDWKVLDIPDPEVNMRSASSGELVGE